MKKMLCNAMVALTIIPLLNSCGKSDSTDEADRLNEEVAQQQPHIDYDDDSNGDGQYQAKFATLNSHVNGTIPGSLTMVREGDKFMTYLRLFAGKPKAWHQQGIHSGKRCPILSDDTNNDGFIDINEALNVVGPVVIPLDSNMNTQAAGRNFYPLGDLSGYYHYERIASFERLFSDLYEVDSDPNDHITKLAASDKFGLVGRVVMVQGIDESTILPESVGTIGRRRNFQTLPITCGIIARTTGTTPGVLDNGEIPGPVAEVIEGQDHPAPYEDGATGGTVAGTTGTNETNDGEVGDEGGDQSGATGSTAGGSTGGTTGGTSGETTGGTTGRRGGFIGGFIGGSRGGTTGSGSASGGSAGGSTSGGTTTGDAPSEPPSPEEPDRGRFIGGFIGGGEGN